MCYHPNEALIQRGTLLKSGKLGNKIIKIDYCGAEDFPGYEYYIRANEDKEKLSKTWGLKGIEWVMIPCGKCEACRKIERLGWSLRIEKESKEYQNNYFLTLTYNDENLPMKDISINKNTGEIYSEEEFYTDWKGTLQKDDLRKFMNSLRKWIDREYNMQHVRFYACGEYGEKGERPHYHIILMNMPELDLYITGVNKKTKKAYLSNKRIEKIWNKGYINVGEVNWDSITYVAGYCTKKLFGEIKEEIYARKGQEPIFSVMSRRPGIGKEYWEKEKENIYKYDEIINGKGQPLKPPSYYDRLMDIGEHDVMEEIKKQRRETAKLRINTKIQELNKKGISLKEQLEIDEREAKEKSKRYNRDRIRYT